MLLLFLLAITPSFTVINPVLGSSSSPTNEVVTENTSTEKAPMPTPRFGMRVAVVNNKIYVLGGYDEEWKVLRVNEVYDPATDTWENKAPLPTITRAGMNAEVANGSIYVIGGNPNATLNEAYNPETDTWSTKASIQYYQEINQSIAQFTVEPGHSYFGRASTVTLDEKICWIGDMRSTDHRRQFMLVYNPINDSWSAGTQPPALAILRTAIATTGVWAPKQIYVVSPVRVMYDPATRNWSSGTEIPYQDGSGYAVVNDKIYCFGGRDMSTRVVAPGFAIFTGEVITADNKEYIPFGYGTIPPEVSAVSVQNSVNVRGDVSFNYSVNKPTQRIYYSLDGADNQTVTGNFYFNRACFGLA